MNTAQHKIQNTKMKYKIIVLDLDGTLTNDKKEITPRTKEVLIKAQTEGVKVVLASGRPTYGITAIAEELELPPVKIHCSILAEDAVKAAVADYKKKKGV